MNVLEAVTSLVSRGNVLLGVDFDGTLAPLVARPDLAEPDPEALSHLRELARHPDVHVAVVSGRSVSDLRSRLGDVPGAILVGEHGNDRGEETPAADVIGEATQFVHRLRGDRDVAVETKARSVTFHTRSLPEHEADEAASRIRAWAQGHPEVALLEGKEVLELTVATQTKGDAIEDLALGRSGVIYIGDDTTDETVFALLGPDDVGVKVGPGPTAARFRVADVPAVTELLEAAVKAAS